MKVGILYSRVRAEEKLLFQAFENRGVDYDLLDDRKLDFEVSESPTAAEAFSGYDVVLERCINHSRALASLRVLNEWGIPTVNRADVAEVCGNKLHTSSVLARAKVATPRTFTAFTPQSALATIEKIGYPVVMKPAVGSWGRLLSKINAVAFPLALYWYVMVFPLASVIAVGSPCALWTRVIVLPRGSVKLTMFPAASHPRVYVPPAASVMVVGLLLAS